MKDKMKNVIIIIMLILIFLLGGLCVYLLLNKKKATSEENNVYVTDDGKNRVQLLDVNDEKARGDAKKEYFDYFKKMCETDKTYMDYFKNISCSSLDSDFDTFFKDSYKFKGYAYVNDKLIEIKELNEVNDYIAVSGEGIYEGSQCYSNNFLINKNTKKIDKYNSGMYNFIKDGNNYYITKTACEMEKLVVYTKNFKELGEFIVDKLDSDGSVYVKKDNIIYKFNQNGEELKKSDKFNDIGNAIFYNDTLYVVIRENGKAYLLNMDTLDKVFITNRNDSYPLVNSTSLEFKNEKIIITMYFDYSKNFTFDPVNNKIVK